MSKNHKIILASASPRRQELLKLITDEFEVITADVDESFDSSKAPEQIVMLLSEKKASAVAENYPDCTVIGADTVVVSEGKILGKPKSEEDSFSMLSSLSGKTHQVLTGVTVIKNGEKDIFYVSSDVKFFDLTDEEILAYIKTGEPADKAGSYGIQGKGSFLVEKINGDYFNIVGLPIAQLKKHLK